MVVRKTPVKPAKRPVKPKPPANEPMSVFGAVRTDDVLASLVAMRDSLARVMDSTPTQAAAAAPKLLEVLDKIAALRVPVEKGGIDELEDRRRKSGHRVPEAKSSGSSVRESRRVRGG